MWQLSRMIVANRRTRDTCSTEYTYLASMNRNSLLEGISGGSQVYLSLRYSSHMKPAGDRDSTLDTINFASIPRES